MHTKRGLAGMRDMEHKACSTPLTVATSPQVCPAPSNQKDFSARPRVPSTRFPQLSKEGYPEVSATSNIQEGMTFKSLFQANRDSYMRTFLDLTHHHSTMALAAKGERMQGKGQGSGGEIVSYLNRPKWPKVLPQPPLLPKQEESML